MTIEDDAGSFTMGDDLPRPDWLDPALPLPDGFAFDNLLTVDEITSARGPTDLDATALSQFFTSAVTDLGWQINDENLAGADFWQLFVTDIEGSQLDIELVQGKLAFVIGRVRPAG